MYSSIDDLSDALVEALSDELVVEREGWAYEQAERVLWRLQRGRPLAQRKEVHVLWSASLSACAIPGRHILVSRHLLSECHGDDALVAMILAHELAHHDLGHLGDAGERMMRMWGESWADALGRRLEYVLAGLQQFWERRDNERQADAHGLDLCIQAGYDGEHCVELFDVLIRRSLDRGDVSSAYGADAQGFWGQIKRELGLQFWGYDPLMERRERLMRRLG